MRNFETDHLSNVYVAPTRVHDVNSYRESRAAICNLLIAQYKAAGVDKKTNVLAFIAERIKRLGGEVPVICVASKRLTAVQELVQAAIAVVPHLVAFNIRQSGLDGWFVQSVSSALSDAYRLASSDRILGVELLSFMEAEATEPVAEAKARIEQGLIISVKQYIELLVNIVPLAYERNSSCVLWLNEKNEPGKPLQNLIKDINRMQELSRHLSPADRIRFDKAIDLARLAFTVRTDYPLTENDNHQAFEADDVYHALCKMLEWAENEDTIEKTHKAFRHGNL